MYLGQAQGRDSQVGACVQGSLSCRRVCRWPAAGGCAGGRPMCAGGRRVGGKAPASADSHDVGDDRRAERRVESGAEAVLLRDPAEYGRRYQAPDTANRCGRRACAARPTSRGPATPQSATRVIAPQTRAAHARKRAHVEHDGRTAPGARAGHLKTETSTERCRTSPPTDLTYRYNVGSVSPRDPSDTSSTKFTRHMLARHWRCRSSVRGVAITRPKQRRTQRNSQFPKQSLF